MRMRVIEALEQAEADYEADHAKMPSLTVRVGERTGGQWGGVSPHVPTFGARPERAAERIDAGRCYPRQGACQAADCPHDESACFHEESIRAGRGGQKTASSPVMHTALQGLCISPRWEMQNGWQQQVRSRTSETFPGLQVAKRVRW
eukprot:jgi/Botrbrau1/20189/Bobra.0646s0001.1